MQAVGKLGSYISKSVVTVSGPFHPFGGAVDIVVVEQPDGSYKSSPWYVRLGKFQGVLKAKEKVVNISVNGLEADFHMYLDHKGESYFLREVDVEEGTSSFSPTSSSGEDTDRQSGNRRPMKSKSYNYNADSSGSILNGRNRNTMVRTNSRRSQILGLVFGRKSMKECGIQEEVDGSGVVRINSLERAEIAGPANPPFGNAPRSTDSLSRSRGSWSFSFKRSRGVQVSQPAMDGIGIYNVKNIPRTTDDMVRENDVPNLKINKKKIRMLTPTSEQLASLNLKEGRNIVIFNFSTAMLGKQQVEARVYLWRWDTKIVISDVDGTITRSDLLGQVMPWVGMDWSQTGVAHLFTAIKENGYQLLFLSARSISQAYHTRQFLFNLKQNGKALPDGPVVISPDGLFPSLFREVVRRAPHEFKIACLEGIRALFPSDRNPFYAGFGNRDTDEFSYLKVGIPRGKIFIINPKGEIVVNRRTHTKSYTSLCDLVHGMFPSMSSSEQEDFNQWNFWKLPLPLMFED